jgi:hypothetical protein
VGGFNCSSLRNWSAAYSKLRSTSGRNPTYTTSRGVVLMLCKALECGSLQSHITRSPARQGTCSKPEITGASSRGLMGVKSPTHGGAVGYMSMLFTCGGRSSAHCSNDVWKAGTHSNPPSLGRRVSVSAMKAWIGRHLDTRCLGVYMSLGQQSRCGVSERCRPRTPLFLRFVLTPCASEI